MQDPIHIIAAFSNDSDDPNLHLRSLDEENRDIGKAFSTKLAKEKYQYLPMPAATGKDIREALSQSSQQVKIFHFAGHANSLQLLLKKDDGSSTTANASGFATWIKNQENLELELVFLNACATMDQAELFLKAGVKTVIATKYEVDDKLAKALSVEFYEQLANGQHIRQAFKSAIAGKLMDESGAKRFLPGDLPVEGEAGGIAWKIFGDGSWMPFPPPKATKTGSRLSPTHRFYVNRDKQDGHFATNLRKKKRYVHFVLLHGEEVQSHNGLVTRFQNEYIRKNCTEEEIKIAEIPVKEWGEYEDSLKIALYKNLIRPMPDKFLDQLTFENLVEEMMHEKIKKAIVSIRVSSSIWNSDIFDLLKWFNSQYCQLQHPTIETPELFFFLQIMYDRDEEPEKPGFFGRLFGKSKSKSAIIKEQLAQLGSYLLLEELDAVSPAEVKAWFADVADIDQVSEKEALFAQHFDAHASSFDMQDVEHSLEQVILSINQKSKSSQK